MWSLSRLERRFIEAVGLLTGLCLLLFVFRILITGNGRFWFIPGNLLLAWMGFGFGWLLSRNLNEKRWKSWQNLSLTALWLFFLPNTWYVLTDFIHVQPTGEVSELYDVVLITSLVCTGFILGIASLYLVHKQLIKRLPSIAAYRVIELIILLESFGIYLGRDLRWNSWDLLTDPSGIIINVSDRVIDPLGHPSAINVTALFFILLSVTYGAVYRVLQAVPVSKRGG